MQKPRLAWVVLGLILLALLAYVSRQRPTALFGWYHDDTIYFSAAQSLAQGHGYRIASLPGEPIETKYPIFYPWLLSWVWKWNPSFPANVTLAVWMTAFFGCVFLTASFELLCRLGMGVWTALTLAGLCAFHPDFLVVSQAVLSDVPFMAMALTAAVVADSATRKEGWLPWAALAAALAGLSLLMRGFGLAVLAGIFAGALYRRAYRQAVVFCLVAAPFVLGGLLWPRAHPELAVPLGSAPGWRQTWLFYTSYGDFWRLTVPRVDVLLAMFGVNLRRFLLAPAEFCLFPALGDESYAGVLFNISLGAGILAGIVRQARSGGGRWMPIHFILFFYTPIVLLWNYSLMDRFLQLFLPLFYAGLWVEGRHLFSMLRKTLAAGQPAGEKILAGVMAVGVVALALTAADYYIRRSRPAFPALIARRAALLEEKKEIYAWIRDHTDPGARFIAYEDASLFLYTGRQAARPIAFSTEAFYMKDEAVLNRDLDHILDVARSIGARYWVASADDFDLETGLPLIEKRVANLKSGLPVLFRSRNGKVRLYDLSCAIEPQNVACRTALNPLGTGGGTATPGSRSPQPALERHPRALAPLVETSKLS